MKQSSLSIETPTGKVKVVSSGSFVCSSPQSSIITQWVYLTEKHTLCVMWGSKEYFYKAVPLDVVVAMMKSESLAGFMNAEVKPHYEIMDT